MSNRYTKALISSAKKQTCILEIATLEIAEDWNARAMNKVTDNLIAWYKDTARKTFSAVIGAPVKA